MRPSGASQFHPSLRDRFRAKTSPSSGAYHLFNPTLDGKAFTDYPDRLLLQGKYTEIPLITGYVGSNLVPMA